MSRLAVVGAVGDEHEPGQGHRGELLAARGRARAPATSARPSKARSDDAGQALRPSPRSGRGAACTARPARAAGRALGPKDCAATAPRGSPSSAMRMLRESSTSTPRKLCCGTTVERTRAGRQRQKRTRARAARAHGGEDQRSRRARPIRARSGSSRRRRPRPTARTTAAGQGGAITNRPFSNRNGRYLKRNSKTDSRKGPMGERQWLIE